VQRRRPLRPAPGDEGLPVVDDADVDRLAAAARTLPPVERNTTARDFVANLFVTVLDYQQRTVVVDRALEHAAALRIRSPRTLERTIGRFPDDRAGNEALALHLWGYRLWTRAAQLRGLCAFFHAAGVVDERSLETWARSSEFRRDFEGRVKGLGRAVYESLVMRAGVDTVKPDVHVRRFAEAAIGRRLSDSDLVEAVARAASRLGLRAAELDLRIWAAAAAA
jgi:hypothetical protein